MAHEPYAVELEGIERDHVVRELLLGVGRARCV
jgi:hypothetical protein